MDRLNQLRAGSEGGRSGDSTLDSSSPPSEAYMSANESSSKYFSFSESTFDISPIKDVSLASAASATEPDHTLTDPDELLSNLSPITKKDVMLDSYKIGKQIEAANILSGGVDIFEDNDNSFDGDELVIDDNVDIDDKSNLDDKSLDEVVSEATLLETHVDLDNKDTEVVLQIDGKNVDAIDIGNGLYLYRKAGQDELAAVQIITEGNQQSPSFKFLKVRENVEGNLEVYEEFEIEVSNKDPVGEAKLSAKNTPRTPIKDTRKVISESSSKIIEKKDKTPPKDATTSKIDVDTEAKDPESKSELNLNGKMMKFNESRKSPVIGFTPMTYHSTPNKEGKPLTKTMVDQQLHPSRHSDNVKKTIEVHTDSQTKKLADEMNKQKSESKIKKVSEISSIKTEATEKVQPEILDKHLEKNDDDTSIHKPELQKIDDKIPSKIHIIEPAKTLVDNKPRKEEEGTSKDCEVEIKDTNDKEKNVNIPKPKSADVSGQTIKNVVSKSSIFCSLLGATKVDQILKSETDIIPGLNSNVLDKTKEPVNVFTIDDEKGSSVKNTNIAVVESNKPKTTKVDLALEKSKGINEQKLEAKSYENVKETAGNTIDLLPTNQSKEPAKPSMAIQEESPEIINDKKPIEEDKNLAVSSIPRASTCKLETLSEKFNDTTKKEVNITEKLKDTEQITVLEVEKSCQVTNEETSKTKINSIAQVNERNVTKNLVADGTESKQSSLIKMTNQVENKNVDLMSQPDKLNPISMGIDSETVLNIDKINTIAKSIDITTDSQHDKLNIVAKPIEQTEQATVLKTEKLNPVSEVDTKRLTVTVETNVLENKSGPINVSQPNTIPVSKGIEPRTFVKTVLVHSTETKIEPATVSQNYKIVADPKMNNPKTYSKTEKPNHIPKGIEAKAISKYGVINPVTKGFELKTVPKTVLLNPIPKGIEPKVSKSEKAVPIVSQIPKSNAVIITSNKVIVPSKVNLTNAIVKVPEESSIADPKAINNNHTAVPFGKWTDANRQEFLNKFKEIKVPATSNTKQIKNSNDLNRIDVLKKIDSQRSNTASAKGQDKPNVKETVFSTKIAPPKIETKIPIKIEGLKIKAKPESTTETVTPTVSSNASTSDVATSEPEERREVNVNDLIGRAIVDMLNRPVPMPMTRSPLDEPRHVDNKDLSQIEANADHQYLHVDQNRLKTDPKKLNIDQQKLKNDPQKLNIDQQKLKTDPQKLNIDQQKLKTDPQKPKIEPQKPKIDPLRLNIEQQKLKTDSQKLDVDQQILTIEQRKLITDQQKLNIEQKIDEDSSGSLDDIEMKMNELHGIPFVERPPHELPRVHKTYSKSNKGNQNKEVKNLPATSKQNLIQQNVIDLESDEEIIEHEPITGDIDLSKKTVLKLPEPVKTHASEITTTQIKEAQKKPIFTENDFDKFARRNSITYENCLTVNFDGKVPANVVQTVKEKDASKVYHKNEIIRTEAMTKLTHKQNTSQIQVTKIPNTKLAPSEDPNNKNYHSKIHSAYQSALTAKRQMDRPITIIEDKPVKVVFMDANAEFVPNQLNVQGKELSPAKKAIVETTKVSHQAASSDVTDPVDDIQQDDAKTKTKHQRKQVLTPVEVPDLELIQPRDIGIDVSPKKKRKTDDNKTEKTLKNLVHKKSYLLGRAVNDEKTTPQEVMNPRKETINRAEIVVERTVSAIDSLVKAAELLENQSVHSASPNPDSQQNTPMKRGRGRPRKYPLPDGSPESKIAIPSPQKKPRLIVAKPVERDAISDEETSDEEQLIRENWTMGKINENIVCPICNKLFRSENVVFKHVKHCTGVSPTRSDIEKRSPRRRKYSKESDNKSFDSQSDDMEFDEKPKESVKKTPKRRKSKESISKLDEVDVIVIEDTPVKKLVTEKEPISKTMEEKQQKNKTIQEQAKETTKETKQTVAEEKPIKEKTLKEIADEKSANVINLDKLVRTKKAEEKVEEKPNKMKKLPKTTVQTSNLVCEFCGKTFRQLSYLSNHKLQHKKEQLKKLEAKLTAKIQVFSCEVCKKEFRMLHHLVQHRISHNSDAPLRTSRKNSLEQTDIKTKEQPAPKQNDDTSAGFRCEPCDKSFRKLHHLVEHRETHDGINRQKTNAHTVVQPIEKPPPPPQCDVCKKSFRKLHHLIEHKEQHHVEQVETSSEKSDDKSVQSSLSTRDIIHECSLCYMVFPNEHSLNKHFIICQQKKKRQLKPKDKPENIDGVDTVEDSTNIDDSMDTDGEPITVAQEIIDDDKVETVELVESKNVVPKKIEKERVSEKHTDNEKIFDAQKPIAISEIPIPKEKEITELKSAPAKRDLPISDYNPDAKKVVPEKIKKIEVQQVKESPKKTTVKDKVAPSVTKRQKSIASLPVLPEGKPVESSDDDEIRYMLNPNFKVDEILEGKAFMKVRSNKRNSLQIERPNSRDLMSRRTSLQHPPKIPRVKAKAVVPKVVPTVTKNVPKPQIQAASTDSDDSEIKYSFPETVTEPASKLDEKQKKAPRKSLAEKRKSLSGIAKRKSVGQTIAKLKVNPSPVRVIKRRTLDVEHRCDCGQLFNSAALLTRHTSLAHTPPRIRRRRSPPPESSVKPPRNSADRAKTTRKSSAKSEASANPTRKSSVKSDAPESRKSNKPERSQEKKSSAKPRRTPAHRGVPVPEKMRKLMMNAK